MANCRLYPVNLEIEKSLKAGLPPVNVFEEDFC